MASILDYLNPVQQEAVTFNKGPLLILAGAGSGKTRVLTHRAAWLIQEKGTLPEEMILLTFTNRAASEMKERIIKLLGEKNHPPFAGTFHSFCAKVLRSDGHHIGIQPSFTIYDEQDSQEAIKMIIQKLDLPSSFRPQTILSAISGAKNELVDPFQYSEFAQSPWQKKVAQIYLNYQKMLEEAQTVDFDDLLTYIVKLFRSQTEVLEKYQRQYRFILVDEWQDTNRAQYQITKMLASKHRDLTVVGDASQCLLPDARIQTPTGIKLIKDIQKNDLVVAAAGRGNIHTVSVKCIKVSQYNGKIFVIKTKSGKVIKATPNHIFFARLSKSTNSYYVYLMYRRDKGYRIGITQGTRTTIKGKFETGLLARSNQESADKMWVLKVCKNRAEANFWEQWFVVTYGIPSMVFSTGGRKMAITQAHIDQLYQSINTKERVQQLFSNFSLFEDYPHHRPKGLASRISPDRQIIYFTLFSDKRPSKRSPWCGHRVSINTSHMPLKQKLADFRRYIRGGNRNTWRIENCYWSYESALNLAEQVSQAGGGLPINHSAFIIEGRKFLFTPASHLRETMEVGIIKNDKIVTDKIVSVKQELYNGNVYDIDVDTLHNYVANGVVVHNSIYSWRGANYRNLEYLTRDFPDIKVINLEQNYRSTGTILDAAFGVISKNTRHPVLRLWTKNKRGERLTLYQAANEMEEAQFIVQEVEKLVLEKKTSYHNIAVLYRTNAQSRVIEEAFLHAGIPYAMVGGTKFYDRREIKDVLAYLRLTANAQDLVSRKRIEKLGKGRLLKFDKFLESQKNIEVEEITTLVLQDKIIDATGYLDLYDPDDPEDAARLENIKELHSVATEFPNLIEFLENVALIENQPDRTKTNHNSVTLMTAHAAKGLEFDIVFIVGLEEGIFPHARSLENEEEIEEERRLCYVGITRAKHKLYLTFCSKRMIFGQRTNNLPSRFLSDIPQALLEEVQTPINKQNWSWIDEANHYYEE